MGLASLWVLDGRLDGHNLVVEPTSLLRLLGTVVRLRSVVVLHLAGDVEVGTNVLGGLTHGLKAVLGLASHELGHERAHGLGGSRHGLGTHGKTNVDAAHVDLVGNVLDGLEARRAEAVDGGGGGGVGEAGGERGRTDVVGGTGVVDLYTE